MAMEEFDNMKPPTPLLITYDPELVRKQAAASTRRFEEGMEISASVQYATVYVQLLCLCRLNLISACCTGCPLSVLDGIFMAIKDDIDCFPHPSKGN